VRTRPACISMRHRGSMHSSGYGQVSGQGPGGTSGSYNRSLCRSAPALSVIRRRTARLTGYAAHPGRPVLRGPARAGRRAGLVGTCGRGGRAAGSALQRWRAALCPDLDAAASRGVSSKGSRIPVRGWIRRSRSCNGRGPVMDLPCTCRVPAPVTRRITRLRCPLVAAVGEVPDRLT
jgi:hypothetical protein